MSARFKSWIIAGPAVGARLAALIAAGHNDEALDLLAQIGGPAPTLARELARRASA